jgi:E3 Ubiquitin ligase
MSNHESVKFWLLVLGLAGAAIYSFADCFVNWRKNRVVEDLPTSRIRSAAQGYVEFAGRGVMLPDTENKAPLSGIPCAWWRYTIEHRGWGGGSRSWSAVASDISTAPFLLDDGTGRCLVDPRGAEVFANAKDVWYGDSEWPDVRMPSWPGIAGWIADACATGKYRYTEHRLQSPTPVYAVGSFRCLSGVSVESPERATAELLRDWKRDQKSLLEHFDTNHDGVLAADEWDRARAAARKQVIDGLSAQPQTPGLSVLSKPTDGRAFLLSASDKESLARRLHRRAIASIVVFVGSSGVLTWLMTHV